MPIPNNPNSMIDGAVPTAPEGSVSSMRLNFIRMANEIQILQADITHRGSASGATGPTGAQGSQGTAAAAGPTGATGSGGIAGVPGAQGPPGGGGGGGAIVAAVTSPFPTQPSAASYPTGTLLALYTSTAVTRIFVKGAGGSWLTLYP